MHPAIELLLVIALPLLLILTKVVRHRARFYVLALVVVAASIVFIVDQESWKSIGLRTDNLLPALGAYALFTVAGYLSVRWYANFHGDRQTADWKNDKHFHYLFIPISIAQQYVFMAFALPRLASLVNVAAVAILLNAAVFALMHTGYGELKKNLPLAVVAGVGFSAVYLYFPNLIASSLSHMALNLTAVYYGFFTSARE